MTWIILLAFRVLIGPSELFFSFELKVRLQLC